MGSAARYELGEKIAAGGMAEVFRGEVRGPEGFARPVAIKRMRGDFSSDPAFVEMFTREARTCCALQHPNICQVLDFVRDETGILLLVMELIEGKDLGCLMRTGRLPVGISAFIVSELLKGLGYAHGLVRQGETTTVVHRDISPQNILISWEGAVKLSDFGIAKMGDETRVTKSGIVKGKPSYMSPEQVEGEALDGRSDLFAVGVVFHELLTGQRLFGGGGLSSRDVLNRVLIGAIPSPRGRNPEVPEALDALCLGLLERDRERRVPTAQAALDALLDSDALWVDGPLRLAELMTARFAREAPASTRASDVTRTEERGPSGPVWEPSVVDRAVDPLPFEDVPSSRIVRPPETVTDTRPGLPDVPASPAARRWPLGLLTLSGAAVLVLVLSSRPAHEDPVPPAVAPLEPVAPVVPVVQARPTEPVKIRIRSDPAGAEVRIAGAEKGRTPLELELAPDSAEQMVEIRKSGYRTEMRSFVPRRDLELQLTLKKHSRRSAPKETPVDPAPPPPPPSVPSGLIAPDEESSRDLVAPEL